MLKNVLTYFVPRIVLDTGSSHNRHIRVLMESGKYKLLSNGARESGEFIKGLLQYGLHTLGVFEEMQPKTMLVLGVAGGTIIHILHERYPDAAITGVDIDKRMLDVGRKYFGLAQIRQLSTVCDDAQHYIRTTGKSFDLIVIDIFIGPDIPDFVSERPFLAEVRSRLTRGGSVFINYIYNDGYEKKAKQMEKTLRSLFGTVASADYLFNRFFFCSLTS